MLSAGGSLKWVRDTLFSGVKYEELMFEASKAPPGSGGLVFLPYLTGERCPHSDPLARGAWVGLTSRHTRGHLVRSVVEGVSFGMAQLLGIVRAHWAIENQLHWVLDVVFDEDAHRSRKDNAPENLAILRRFAINLIRSHPAQNSMRQKIKRAAWDDSFLLGLLGHMR